MPAPPQNSCMPDTAAPSLRLFLGLWPTRDTLARVLAQAQGWSWPAGARRTPPERIHLTLHFLGNVAADRVPGLVTAMQDVHWEECELSLDAAAVWPVGIAVLEATQVPPALARLHAELADRLRSLELPVEARRYRPHATLARKAMGALPAPGGVAWHSTPGFALVRSLGGGRGYETLQAFGG